MAVRLHRARRRVRRAGVLVRGHRGRVTGRRRVAVTALRRRAIARRRRRGIARRQTIVLAPIRERGRRVKTLARPKAIDHPRAIARHRIRVAIDRHRTRAAIVRPQIRAAIARPRIKVAIVRRRTRVATARRRGKATSARRHDRSRVRPPATRAIKPPDACPHHVPT